MRIILGSVVAAAGGLFVMMLFTVAVMAVIAPGSTSAAEPEADVTHAVEASKPAPEPAGAAPEAQQTQQPQPTASAETQAAPSVTPEPQPEPEPISRPMLSTKYGHDAAEVAPDDWDLRDALAELTLTLPNTYEISLEYDRSEYGIGQVYLEAGQVDRSWWYLEHADDDFLSAFQVSRIDCIDAAAVCQAKARDEWSIRPDWTELQEWTGPPAKHETVQLDGVDGDVMVASHIDIFTHKPAVGVWLPAGDVVFEITSGDEVDLDVWFAIVDAAVIETD